jgi:hypothetical protein
MPQRATKGHEIDRTMTIKQFSGKYTRHTIKQIMKIIHSLMGKKHISTIFNIV